MGTPELRELLVLLREQGVSRYRNGGIEIQLGPLPGTTAKAAEPKPPETAIEQYERIGRQLFPNG